MTGRYVEFTFIAQSVMKNDQSFRAVSYSQIAHILSTQEFEQRKFNPDVVVAVCRGGMIPASMVSATLGLPMLAVNCDRQEGKINWLLSPTKEILERQQKGALRALVVDDILATGGTFEMIDQFMKEQGIAHAFNVVFYDEEKTKTRPDIGEPTREWICFPWDAREHKPRNHNDAARYNAINDRENQKNYVIDGLLAQDPFWAERLRQGGCKTLPIEAEISADWFYENSTTHYFTPDREEAINVAKNYPLMEVIWWNQSKRSGILLRAADFLDP
jgi:hypoxanthine phosphoribosyltransferase